MKNFQSALISMQISCQEIASSREFQTDDDGGTLIDKFGFNCFQLTIKGTSRVY